MLKNIKVIFMNNTWKDKLYEDFSQLQEIYYLKLNESLEELVDMYFDLNMPIFELLKFDNEAFHCKELCLEYLNEFGNDDQIIFETINDLLIDIAL